MVQNKSQFNKYGHMFAGLNKNKQAFEFHSQKKQLFLRRAFEMFLFLYITFNKVNKL